MLLLLSLSKEADWRLTKTSSSPDVLGHSLVVFILVS